MPAYRTIRDGASARRRGALPGLRLSALAAAVALGGASAGWAQTASPAPGDGSSVRITSLTVGVEGLYDSNVARTSEAGAILRHIIPEDYILGPQGALQLQRPLGREAVFIDSTIEYDFYQRNRRLDTARLNLFGGGVGHLSICTGTLSGRYVQAQSDLRDLELPEVQNTATTRTGDFSAYCQTSGGLRPSFEVSEGDVTNSLAVRAVANFNTFTVQGGIGYSRPVLGRISLYGEYRRTDYYDAVVVVVPDQDVRTNGFRVYTGGFQVDHHVGSRFEVTGQVGFTKLTPDLPTARFSGLTYTADILFHTSGRSTVKLDLVRAASPSTRIGSSYTDNSSYEGEVEYVLNPRINLALGASTESERYFGNDLAPSLFLTQERTNTYYGNINLLIGRRLKFLLDIRQENRKANISVFDYSSTRVSLTLSSHF